MVEGNSGMESSNMLFQTTSAGKTNPANCTLNSFYFFSIKFTFGDTFLNTDDNE